jgi:hypothetical protein
MDSETVSDDEYLARFGDLLTPEELAELRARINSRKALTQKNLVCLSEYKAQGSTANAPLCSEVDLLNMLGTQLECIAGGVLYARRIVVPSFSEVIVRVPGGMSDEQLARTLEDMAVEIRRVGVAGIQPAATTPDDERPF